MTELLTNEQFLQFVEKYAYDDPSKELLEGPESYADDSSIQHYGYEVKEGDGPETSYLLGVTLDAPDEEAPEDPAMYQIFGQLPRNASSATVEEAYNAMLNDQESWMLANARKNGLPHVILTTLAQSQGENWADPNIWATAAQASGYSLQNPEKIMTAGSKGQVKITLEPGEDGSKSTHMFIVTREDAQLKLGSEMCNSAVLTTSEHTWEGDQFAMLKEELGKRDVIFETVEGITAEVTEIMMNVYGSALYQLCTDLVAELSQENNLLPVKPKSSLPIERDTRLVAVYQG